MDIDKIVTDAPKILADFYGISVGAARERINYGSRLVAEEWEKHEGSYLDFYKTVQNYPFDLAKFNSMWRLELLTSIFDYMAFEGADFVDYNEYDGKPTLLEFGGGAGELALALSDKFDVTYYDIPSVTSDYARHRSEVHYGSPIKICTELPDEKFDFISMQDVYEHVENPKALMKDVRERLKDGGLFISSALWFSTSHPLHINENAAGREAVGVYFAMNYKMWLTHTFESEGIQGEEAATTIGAFKHKPVLNDVLGEHLDIYLAKKVVYESLPIPECLKHLDMMCKESYVMTIM